MKTLAQVRTQLSAGEFDFTRHAVKRAVERNISVQEIVEAGATAEAIEEYADDKYTPSCLLLGFTQAGKPLHLQVSLTDTFLVRIITWYEPSEQEWSNYT